MITVLGGVNRFGVQLELHRIVDAFVAEHGDMALERLDGETASYERMAEAVQSLPFLAAKKLVVLTEPSANKQFVEQAETLLADVPESTELVLVEHKLDKRSSYYKFLKKLPGFKEFPELDVRGLTNWATSYVKEKGGKLSARDADYLINRIGINQQRLASELDKLLLVSETIDRASIDELTEPTPQSKIFDLLDAAFNGQAKRAMELYADQRAQRVEPQEILAMVGWQLRQVALAKSAVQRSGTKHDLVGEGKMSPYGATKAKRLAARLTLAEVKQLVADLVELDAKSKRTSINLDQALKHYLLKLS